MRATSPSSMLFCIHFPRLHPCHVSGETSEHIRSHRGYLKSASLSSKHLNYQPDGACSTEEHRISRSRIEQIPATSHVWSYMHQPACSHAQLDLIIYHPRHHLTMLNLGTIRRDVSYFRSDLPRVFCFASSLSPSGFCVVSDIGEKHASQENVRLFGFMSVNSLWYLCSMPMYLRSCLHPTPRLYCHPNSIARTR